MQHAIDEIEQAAAQQQHLRYKLRLYVTGATPKSSRAIANIKAICEEYLPARYDLEVIDLYQRPTIAREEDVLAVPTLVKSLPLPLMRLIGDLSDLEHVLAGLDIHPVTREEE